MRLNILYSVLGVLLGLASAYAAVPAEPTHRFDVRGYGATGDGKTIDTLAINKAIAAATEAGGGTVYFSAGSYLSFSIHLASHVVLELDPGATVIAATPSQQGDYDPREPNQFEPFQDKGHSHWHNSLIWGENLEDVAIIGKGKIIGTGLVRGLKRQTDTGDKAIALKRCRKVLLRDFTIQHGGHFAILCTGVDGLNVEALTIDTNRDGINLDCSSNVQISNCTVNAPLDDGICLKSSYALGEPKPTENITIKNCRISGYDEGTLIDGTHGRNDPKTRAEGPVGRIKLGTESYGGFRNVNISDCVFDYCRGLALETVDGGILEDVTIDNIRMTDTVDSPIFLRLGARARGPFRQAKPGALRRVTIRNVTSRHTSTRLASIISGIPGSAIEQVTISNVDLQYAGEGTKLEATTQPAESIGAYPDPAIFGQIPAYGFYVRHAKDIRFDKVTVSYQKTDLRPAFVFEDVAGTVLSRTRAQHEVGVPSVRAKSITGLRIEHCDGIADAERESVAEECY